MAVSYTATTNFLYWLMLVAVGLAGIYVSIIYLASYLAAPDAWLDRDDNRVIKARIFAVLTYAGISLLYFNTSWALMVGELLRTQLLLAPVLYIHSITYLKTFPPRLRKKHGILAILVGRLGNIINECLISVLKVDWPFLRDYIIGPFSEECIFRQSILSVLADYRILKSAAIFSLSHAHSLITDTSTLSAVVAQCLFTFIFGIYIGDVYVRTRSVLTCTLVHALCNRVGFPDGDDFSSLYKNQIAMTLILLGLSITVGCYF